MSRIILSLIIAFCSIIPFSFGADTNSATSYWNYGFIENMGQITDVEGHPVEEVFFCTESPEAKVYITSTGLTYTFFRLKHNDKKAGISNKYSKPKPLIDIEMSWINLHLEGGSIKKENIIKEGISKEKYNFFYTHCPEGIYGAKKYEKITIRDVYPSIDWVLYGTKENGFKYDFVVHPGAHPEQIKLIYEGEQNALLDNNGSVYMESKLSKLRESPPISYINTPDDTVKSEFSLKVINKYNTEISIKLGPYPEDQILIIDPLLEWGTLIGDMSANIYSMDTDPEGNLFITGSTMGTSYPVLNTGTYFSNIQGGGDVFISKFSNSGVLLWSTYYGSSDESDVGQTICTDNIGNIYVAGETFSGNFPLQNSGAYYDGIQNGFRDPFIIKFDNSGNRLWATYFGGSDVFDDYVTEIDCDANGNLFFLGFTDASDHVTFDAGTYYDGSIGGVLDIVVAKFSNNGTLLWSTFFGGDGVNYNWDASTGLEIAPNQDLYITGYTGSSNFPTLASTGYFDNTYGIPPYASGTSSTTSQGIISRFSNSGDLLWSTFYGGDTQTSNGTYEVVMHSIIADDNNNVFIYGSCDQADFPTYDAGTYYDNTANSTANYIGVGLFGVDNFILKFDDNNNRLWATYFGGSEWESVIDYPMTDNLAIDSCQNLYVVTSTQSPDIPVLDPGCSSFFDGTFNGSGMSSGYMSLGGGDVALTKFTNTGAMLWSTYLGSDNIYIRSSVAIEANVNDVFVAAHNGYDGTSQNFQTIPQLLVNPNNGAYYDANTSLFGDRGILMKFIPDTLQLTYTTTPAGCINDGSADLEVCGTPPFTFQWSTGQTSEDVTNMYAGNYTVTIYDSSCPVRTGVYDIIIPGASGNVTVTTSQIDPACGVNGSATVNPAGGTSPYNYQWSANTGDQTTQTATLLPEGIYTCTVTDNNNCSTVATVILIDTAVCSIIATDISICEGETGQVSVTASFGTAPYTYAWSDGLPSNSGPHDVSPLVTTGYVVTVTDNNGDVMIDTATVTVLSPPVVSIGHDTTLCATVTDFLLDAGNPDCTFLWSDNSTNQTLTVNQTGIYSVTVTNANNCSSVDSIVVCFGIFTSTVNITDASCNGMSDGAIDLTIITGQAPYNYIWSNTEITQNISGLIAGSYDVTVTDSIGCQLLSTFTVNEPPVLTVSGTVDNLNCYEDNSGAINITADGGNGGYNYIWSNAQVTEDLSGISASVYTVTVTDINNCMVTETYTVTQPTELTSDIDPTNLLCYEDTDGQAFLTVFGGTPTYTYLWSNGQTSQNATNLTGQTHFVTITDANNCVNIDSVTITGVGTPLSAIFTTTDVLCYGADNGSVEVTTSGATPPYSYNWNTGQSTSIISNMQAGHYYVTITDDNDCQIVEGVEVMQPEELMVTLPNDFYMCLNPEENIAVSVTGGVPAYSYQWSTNETSPSIMVSPIQTTSYAITVTDSNNCTGEDFTTVKVYPPLQIEAITTHDTVCPGNSTLLTATYQGGSGAPYYMYINGVLETLPVTIYPTHGQVYTITIEDQCHNMAEDTHTLYNYPIPPVSFNSDKIEGCQPLEIHFNEFNSYVSYMWSFDDINQENLSLDHNPAYIFENAGSYDISVIVTDTNGCENSLTKSNMITVYPKPDASFIAEPEVVSIIEPEVSFYNTSSGAVNYFWYFGDGTSSSITNPSHNYTQTGTNVVELAAESSKGCWDTVRLDIWIKGDFTFYAPTAFSPGYDGTNDYFRVYGYGISEDDFKLIIYDRWGESIFESENINQAWDGRAKKGKKIVPTGNYTWLCIFKDLNNIQHEKAGVVNVIR